MTVKLTWFGTANYILDLDGTKILFDPFFERNKKSEPVVKTKREDIKDIKAIFITHGHFDHITDAAWLAENMDVPVYCSDIAKANMINWAKGTVFEDKAHPITEKGKNNLKPCNYNDSIEIADNISVKLLESEHVKFDLNTILTRLFSLKVWRQIRSFSKYGKSFPKGKVFGFCTTFNGKKFVSFGSLWHKYEDILKDYENCDVFIVPLAGNSKKHMAIKAGKMVEILKPKIVIPVHWDNFFPPISRLENLEPFFKYIESKFPNIKIIIPEVDKEIAIL